MHLVTGEIKVSDRYIPFRATFFSEYAAKLHVKTWNDRGDKLKYDGEVEAAYDV